MAKAREATRKVTVDMLGEKSLADWNTLQSASIHVNGDARVSICGDTYRMYPSYGRGSYGFFTRPSGILANILDNNKDINIDWLKTFTWPKLSSRVPFPKINHFANKDEFWTYFAGAKNTKRSARLFGKNITIKFNDHFKWTYLGNRAYWESGVYLVVYNGETKLLNECNILEILEDIYLGSDD